MPDPTLSALQVAELAPQLTAILALPAIMDGKITALTPKGRYALARWGIACDAPSAAYGKKMGALIESVALPESIKALPTGGLTFDFKDAECRALYAVESEKINSETVTVSGVRPITHAELGNCPLTGAQEKLLMVAGVLEMVEPE